MISPTRATCHWVSSFALPHRSASPRPGPAPCGRPTTALELRTDELTLRVDGCRTALAAGSSVAAGDPVAEASGHLWVQVARAGVAVPRFVAASVAAAWRTVVADPSALVPGAARRVGRDRRRRTARAPRERVRRRAGALLRRPAAHRARLARAPDRHRRAGVPRHGQQRHLARSRAPAARRCRRRAVAAAQHQLALPLRRGRRVLRAARRARCPTRSTPCSSSTAAPRPSTSRCAWRRRRRAGATCSPCARRTTAGPTLTDAVSTSIADNPGALETRPDWVHTVDAPNPFRGAHAGAGRRAATRADAVAEIERLAAAGTPVGAFIAEAVFGNAGGVAAARRLPRRGLRARCAPHGGLAIADEVQVGYGRLGDWFWGFEQQGVVPDVDHRRQGDGQRPSARRGDHDARRSPSATAPEGYFFSSAGGSPVSSVVGLDGARHHPRRAAAGERARRPARTSRHGSRSSAQRHPILGAVHGSGLYLGLEFVRDRDDVGAGDGGDGRDLRRACASWA